MYVILISHTLRATLLFFMHLDISSLAKPLLKTSDKSTPDWSKHVTPGTLSVFQEDTSWHRLDSNSEQKLDKQHTIPLEQDSTTISWQHMQNMLDSFDEGNKRKKERKRDRNVYLYQVVRTRGKFVGGITITDCITFRQQRSKDIWHQCYGRRFSGSQV